MKKCIKMFITHAEMALRRSYYQKKPDSYVLLKVFWKSWEEAVTFLSSDDVWFIRSRSHSSATYFCSPRAPPPHHWCILECFFCLKTTFHFPCKNRPDLQYISLSPSLGLQLVGIGWFEDTSEDDKPWTSCYEIETIPAPSQVALARGVEGK